MEMGKVGRSLRFWEGSKRISRLPGGRLEARTAWKLPALLFSLLPFLLPPPSVFLFLLLSFHSLSLLNQSLDWPEGKDLQGEMVL